MRDWMRNKMRRRTKRGPNNSEATGKIGQEIPSDQPAALRPSYPDEAKHVQAPEAEPAVDLEVAAASAGDSTTHEEQSGATPEPVEESQPGRIVVETQPESLATPPAEAQSVATASGDKATPKGFVVLAIGLPGSGKTTWFKRRGVTPLSSDMLRSILFDDITDQRYSGLVFSTLRSLLRARLIAKMPWNYVDATNLSAHERRQWIKMAKSFGFDAQAVFFDVPLAVCMERNSKRDRRVADDVMEKMAERLRPPSFKEGFSKITVVRVKGQPGNTVSGANIADTFNAPVPTDDDEAADPSQMHGSAHADASPDTGDGRLETLGHNGTAEEPLAGIEGRLETLSDSAHGEGRSKAHAPEDLNGGTEQPDTYE